MTTDTDLKLEISRFIAASPETVFDAWLSPDLLARFMTPGPDMTVSKAETDAREGGRFLVVMRAGEQDMPHSGTYKKINRAKELAFTWESPMSPVENSVVTLTFDPTDGGTQLTLEHVRFPSEESRDNHEGGWKKILEALSKVI